MNSRRQDPCRSSGDLLEPPHQGKCTSMYNERKYVLGENEDQDPQKIQLCSRFKSILPPNQKYLWQK